MSGLCVLTVLSNLSTFYQTNSFIAPSCHPMLQAKDVVDGGAQNIFRAYTVLLCLNKLQGQLYTSDPVTFYTG